MAEEIKETVSRMSKDAIAILAPLADELNNTFMAVASVLAKKSCNRAEASLIKAHAVILKAKLTELHKAKITNL